MSIRPRAPCTSMAVPRASRVPSPAAIDPRGSTSPGTTVPGSIGTTEASLIHDLGAIGPVVVVVRQLRRLRHVRHLLLFAIPLVEAAPVVAAAPPPCEREQQRARDPHREPEQADRCEQVAL